MFPILIICYDYKVSLKDTFLTEAMTPAVSMKKLMPVMTEYARSLQESSFAIATIPVRAVIMVRMPPPVMMIGTNKKSIDITSSMWIR